MYSTSSADKARSWFTEAKSENELFMHCFRHENASKHIEKSICYVWLVHPGDDAPLNMNAQNERHRN